MAKEGRTSKASRTELIGGHASDLSEGNGMPSGP